MPTGSGFPRQASPTRRDSAPTREKRRLREEGGPAHNSFPGRGSLGRREQPAHEPLIRRATLAEVPLTGLCFHFHVCRSTSVTYAALSPRCRTDASGATIQTGASEGVCFWSYVLPILGHRDHTWRLLLAAHAAWAVCRCTNFDGSPPLSEAMSPRAFRRHLHTSRTGCRHAPRGARRLFLLHEGSPRVPRSLRDAVASLTFSSSARRSRARPHFGTTW